MEEKKESEGWVLEKKQEEKQEKKKEKGQEETKREKWKKFLKNGFDFIYFSI